VSARRARDRRDKTRRATIEAAILTTVSVAIVVAVTVVPMMRHDRRLKERDAWKVIPWDPSWPALAISTGTAPLGVDVTRALYGFAGRHADVLDYIPCYCGCQAQGHRSNADCYVKARSAAGGVTAWDEHGLTCPLADITGDVMLWRENGRPLAVIREDVEREYSSHGSATATPWPPTR